MKTSYIVAFAACLSVSGCQYAGMAPGKAISVSAATYQQCATRKVVAAGKVKDRVAQAEAACQGDLDTYRAQLVKNGLTEADAAAAATKLGNVTRSAIGAAGIG